MTDSSQQTDSRTIRYSSCDDPLRAEIQRYVTTGHESIESLSFAGKSDPFGEVKEILPEIGNPSIVEQTESLLSAIHWMIQQTSIRTEGSNDIPPLRGHIEDDGSVLLEWIFPDFRMGFNIEPSPGDSGWHLVMNKKRGNFTASGPLTDKLNILLTLVSLIVSNT